MQKANYHLKHRECTGFTLIEVMVSLLILSVVVGALSFAMTQSTRNIGQLKQRQYALWVAQKQPKLTFNWRAIRYARGKQLCRY